MAKHIPITGCDHECDRNGEDGLSLRKYRVVHGGASTVSIVEAHYPVVDPGAKVVQFFLNVTPAFVFWDVKSIVQVTDGDTKA